MIDQAESLRQLVMSVAQNRQTRKPGGVIVVLGARPGVGATTTSVNLSIAFSQHGYCVTLVDADFERPTVNHQCGLVTRSTLADLVHGVRTVREVAQVGPAGISVLPGCRFSAEDIQPATSRLAEQIAMLAETHLVVVDLGRGIMHPDLYRVADDVLVVTTVDVESVLDAYSVVKQTASMQTSASFWTVVNQHPDPVEASDVQQRIASSCDRFLNLGVCAAGSIPAHPNDQQEVDRPERPLVLKVPESPVSAAFTAMSTHLIDARRRRNASSTSSRSDPLNTFA